MVELSDSLDRKVEKILRRAKEHKRLLDEHIKWLNSKRFFGYYVPKEDPMKRNKKQGGNNGHKKRN